MIELNLDRLRDEVDWWLARNEDRAAATRALAHDARCSVDVVRKLANRAPEQKVSVDLADRLLLAMGLTWRGTPRRPTAPGRGRVTPVVIRHRYERDGRARQPGETGRIKKVEFSNAKLTEKQLRAIYKLHIDGGHSLRAIAAAGWEKWGYASPKSCLTSISDRLRSIGLKPRDRIEATVRASTTHGHGSRNDNAAYKRWHRRAHGPWPSDLPPPDWEAVRETGDWSRRAA